MEREEIYKFIIKLKEEYPESITVKKLLNELNNSTDEQLRRRTMGFTMESLREYILSNIEKELDRQRVSNNVTLNDYFEYGVIGDTVHIHLPKDLHNEFNRLGSKKAIAQIGIYLIDAVNKLIARRENGDEELRNCKGIYMISPIFYSGGFYPDILRNKLTNEISIESFALIALKIAGIETRTITSSQLHDKKLLETDSEVQLGYKHFGDKKDLGSASLSFEELSTDKWKRKLRIYDKLCRRKVYGRHYKDDLEIE